MRNISQKAKIESSTPKQASKMLAPSRGSWASLALIGVMANAAAAFSPTTGTFILPQALHSAG